MANIGMVSSSVAEIQQGNNKNNRIASREAKDRKYAVDEPRDRTRKG